MACEIVSGEGAVFSLWGKAPSRADMDRVLERLKSASFEATRPVVYVTRVPVDAPPPDTDVRAYISSVMPLCASYCSSYHVVLEGTGFVAALKRGVVASLFQLSWRNHTFYIHAQPDQVLTKLQGTARTNAEKLLQLALAKGLLDAHAPCPEASAAGNGYGTGATHNTTRPSTGVPRSVREPASHG